MLCGAALLLAACSTPTSRGAASAPASTSTALDALPTAVPTTVATAGITPPTIPAPPTLAPTPATSEAVTPAPKTPAAATPALSTPGPATPVPATATDASQVEPAAPPTANAVRFQVVPNQSKAIFHVREQLARLQSPSEAVGSTGKVTGQIVVNVDGTIASDQSQVTVDVTDLRTDDQLRDGVIKRTTLQTQRFPTAQFVPTSATGLPSPLPESGEYTFQLAGRMTLHGVEKDSTWDVTAKREGKSLTGTATTKIQFEDFGMQRPQAAVVLSIVDEIRLEVQLVANQV